MKAVGNCTAWQPENERLPCAGGSHISWGTMTPKRMHIWTGHAQPMCRYLMPIGITLLLNSRFSLLCIRCDSITVIVESLVLQQHATVNLPWPEILNLLADNQCCSHVQGAYRKQRGLVYYTYLVLSHPGLQSLQTVVVVPGCGHNETCMLSGPQFLNAWRPQGSTGL